MPREFYRPRFIRLFSSAARSSSSVLLARKAAKNSPVIESILCKPISGPNSLPERPPPSPPSHPVLSSQLSSYLVGPLPRPSFCHLRSLICRRRGKYCLLPPASPPPPRVIDLCANIEPRRRGRERKWERPDECGAGKGRGMGKGMNAGMARGFNRGQIRVQE